MAKIGIKVAHSPKMWRLKGGDYIVRLVPQELTNLAGCNRYGHQNETCLALPEGKNGCPHGRAGCQPVINNDDRSHVDRHRWPVPTVQLFPPNQLRPLAPAPAHDARLYPAAEPPPGPPSMPAAVCKPPDRRGTSR